MSYGLKTSRRSYAGDEIPLPRFKARALMNNSQNVVQNNTLWTPSEIELLPSTTSIQTKLALEQTYI